MSGAPLHDLPTADAASLDELVELAPRLGPAAAARVRDAALDCADATLRARLLRALAARAAAPQHAALLDEAWRSAMQVVDRDARATELAAVAAGARDALAAFLDAVREEPQPERRVAGLRALAPFLTDALRLAALELVPSLPPPVRGGVLRELAQPARGSTRHRLCAAALADAQAAEPSRRARELLSTAALLDEPERAAVVRDAAGAARAPGATHWAWESAELVLLAAGMVAPPLRDELVAQAVEVARTVADRGRRVTLLIHAAVRATREVAAALRGEALDVACAIPGAFDRGENLAELAPHLDAPLQRRLWSALSAIENDRVRERAAERVIPHLDDELLQGLAAGSLAGDPVSRRWAEDARAKRRAPSVPSQPAALPAVPAAAPARPAPGSRRAAFESASDEQQAAALTAWLDGLRDRARSDARETIAARLEREAHRAPSLAGVEPSSPVQTLPLELHRVVHVHRAGTLAEPVAEADRPSAPAAALRCTATPGDVPAEPVHLGTQLPSEVQRGQEFAVRFVAYPEAAEAEVRRGLDALAPTARTLLGLKRSRWRRGARVSVTLDGPYLSVSPARQEFEWSGAPEIVDFDLRVADDASGHVLTLRFDVLVDGFVVARLRPELSLVEHAAGGGAITVHGLAVSTAFASYAWEDRARVCDAVASLVSVAGVDVFMDVTHLRAGEEWKPRLENEIVARDLFLLFWSHAARESEWVGWEWRTALTRKGLDHITVRPLEPPTDAPPPPELATLNFNDLYAQLTR